MPMLRLLAVPLAVVCMVTYSMPLPFSLVSRMAQS
jgi:hypothetical protein